MNNNNVMPLNEETVNYVEVILSSNLKSNPNFNYSIYINKSFVATIHRSKDIEDYQRFMEDLPSFAQVIDVTTRLGKGNVGQRLTLAIENLQGFDNDPGRPIRNNSHTLGQQHQRETEIKERVELSVRNEYLNNEIKRKEEELERLKKESNVQAEKLKEAENYALAVEKIVRDMQEKGEQNKKSVMDYAFDLEKLAPGLIGRVLGFGKETQPAANALSGTPQPEIDPALLKYAEIVKDLFSKFTEHEFRTLVDIIDLLASCKEVMPQFRHNIQQYLQSRGTVQQKPRTEETPNVTVTPKVKPTGNVQPPDTQHKTVATPKPIPVQPVTEEQEEEEQEEESEEPQAEQEPEDYEANEYEGKGQETDDENTPSDIVY